MRVTTAVDKVTSQQALEKNRFDVMVVDEYIPAVSGISEFISHVRTEWAANKLPLIVTSSSGTIHGVDPGDVQGILMKPVRRKSLQSTLIQTLSIDKTASMGPSQPPHCILVAEDNPINQRVLSMMLSRLGQAAEVVSNGQEAVDSVATGKFDLVFMDVNMPVMDGIEATRVIRSRFGARPIIVAMTADVTSRQSCIDVGMNDFVLKPLRMDELIRVTQKTSWMPSEEEQCVRALQR
jgi:CheY-like chemotaxis protein